MAVSLKKPQWLIDIQQGVEVTKIPTGASSGIAKREWDRLVRGESAPVEIAPAPKPANRPVLKLRIGHGAVA